MKNEYEIFINGEWQKGEGEKHEIINPDNEEIITIINSANDEQANSAIISAKNAFEQSDWSTNINKRIKVLNECADYLEKSIDEIAQLESLNIGKPIRESYIDISDGIACLRYYANLINTQKFNEVKNSDGSTSKIIAEPIGVCSLILPWNFPLLLGIWKLAPALAAGNTVVYKPSEISPLSIIYFTKLLENTNIPKGVFNLIQGEGTTIGNLLVSNKNVDKVSFTGSVSTGRQINKICAQSFKRVSLELGGKSPMIILPDIDTDKVIEWILFGGYLNQGQVCVASSRILVHESIYENILQKLIQKIDKIKIGSPLNADTELGPIVNKTHYKKIQSYFKKGIYEGAELIGGRRLDRKGYYIQPAIFTNVKQDMTLVQEEIFGPVITIQKYKHTQEAIHLANDTQYGLAAGIFTNNISLADEISSKIKAGTVWINNYHIPQLDAPWGGYKNSGLGRELGPQGLTEFVEYKHINKFNELEEVNWYKHLNDNNCKI